MYTDKIDDQMAGMKSSTSYVENMNHWYIHVECNVILYMWTTHNTRVYWYTLRVYCINNTCIHAQVCVCVDILLLQWSGANNRATTSQATPSYLVKSIELASTCGIIVVCLEAKSLPFCWAEEHLACFHILSAMCIEQGYFAEWLTIIEFKTK